ncbi:MAG: hypothetical protein IKJ06_03715 [Clostridia bacterium]|nr:hypothetical protein [Clostridia bacterium]
MDMTFLEELGLSDEQRQAILNKMADDKLDKELLGAGVRNLSAAKGVIKNEGIEEGTAEETVSALKDKYPYLFNQSDPVFSGPAGGDAEDEDEQIRRALGL